MLYVHYAIDQSLVTCSHLKVIPPPAARGCLIPDSRIPQGVLHGHSYRSIGGYLALVMSYATCPELY